HRGSSPATIDALIAMRSMIPRDALWGITHFGRKNFDVIAAAVAMGASEVRIGFEDSYYLSAEEMAEQNYQQVKKLARLIRSMDKQVASPEIARRILNIPIRQQ
ncbi:3-keto-5-aminohexanoate cleavage protein, partial [Salmonella sp. S019_01147]